MHITDIHPFSHDANHEQPQDVARRDVTSTFEVKEVLEHTGDENKRSTLDFKVSWVGYDDTENMWLPYSELRDNSLLHTYLRLHGLARLIPTKFNEPIPKKVGRQPAPLPNQSTRTTRSRRTNQQMDIEQA